MNDHRDDALLSSAFAEFSDELAPYVRPAGTAAAYETVRFRRRVRTGVTIGAAALLLAVPVTAYAVTAGDPDSPPVEPGTPSPTAEASPSPSPEPEPSPSQEPPVSPSPPEVPELGGQLFYLDDSGGLYVDGQQHPGGSWLSLNVSPDGTRVTWVDDNGDLQMSDLDGSNRRLVHENVDGQCVEPVWSGDSSRLLVHRLTPEPNLAVLYLAGGTGDELGETIGCHYRWSADGERLAVLDGDLSELTVMSLDGSDRQSVSTDALDGRDLADLTGISADGGRVSVQVVPAGAPVGDVARSLVSNAIIDVETGEEVTLPVDGALLAVLFQPDGGTLVRVDTGDGIELVLFDAADQVVARTVESAATADLLLLSYVG
jgi:hypothetical protein